MANKVLYFSIDSEFLSEISEAHSDYRYFYEQFMKELKQILKDPNELHINKTYLANLLRWHPDSYELG